MAHSCFHIIDMVYCINTYLNALFSSFQIPLFIFAFDPGPVVVVQVMQQINAILLSLVEFLFLLCLTSFNVMHSSFHIILCQYLFLLLIQDQLLYGTNDEANKYNFATHGCSH